MDLSMVDLAANMQQASRPWLSDLGPMPPDLKGNPDDRRHLRPQEHRSRVGEDNHGEADTTRAGLYRRGRVWWCKYYVNGRPVRESTGAEKEGEAKRFFE